MNTLNLYVTKYVTLSQKAYITVTSFAYKHATALMFVLGLSLLSAGLSDMSFASGNGGEDTTLGGTEDPAAPGYNPKEIRGAVELLFRLIEGSFGALIMVVAGIGAIVAAAFGAYRAAVGMLVVAVGAFILRSLVSLFFGDFSDALSDVPVQGATGG